MLTQTWKTRLELAALNAKGMEADNESKIHNGMDIVYDISHFVECSANIKVIAEKIRVLAVED